MCLIVFAYRSHPGYRLVLAANRDEFLDRPTAGLGLHYPGEQIAAGKDLRSGGTWMALAVDGRFGAITNFRNPALRLTAAPSRGTILLSYLRSLLSARDYLATLSRDSHRYEGFNLVLGDGDEMLYFSNITKEIQSLEPGVYGLSNHLLDTPWPKVVRVKELFCRVLGKGGENIDEELFRLLSDRHNPSDHLLPDTGIGREWERYLAPICIDAPGYATRSSSLLMIDDAGLAELTERSYEYDPGFRVREEVRYQLLRGKLCGGD